MGCADPAATAIVNIGTIVTGRLEAPFADGDAVLMVDGTIAAIGRRADLDLERAVLVIDAGGATLVPGLIDSHCHVVIGDYTPRQKTVDFLESYVHGGITRVISPSEVHAPGRPRDPAGVKALALAAQRCFLHYRPGGMTVHGGSVILEPGLTEADFAELAAQGVWLAKAGFGNFTRPRDCAPLVRWAQQHGFVVMCHTGGASIPGSSPVTADDLLEMLPDVSGHVNGGPTAMADGDVERVVTQTEIALQVVQAGNLRSALHVARLAREAGQLARLLIASDTPTGTGTMPLAVLKSVVELSSLGPLPPEVALAAATGNVGRVYRLEAGILAPGRPADLLLLDAPLGSHDRDALHAIARGDIPAVAAVCTAGELRVLGSRNTPPPTRPIRVIRDATRRWS
ncbi:MAG: amidohydrolase [Armatimonadota bacterium]|nr:amidohydrolase [Armatimonadota bacterium]MDR7534192.1 amidohydrolase [Armatimonadota bacterium]MDR7537651.1 amidohydrolase [Armatimonadota bacterium]